jgi:hypothetical protein
MTIYPTIQKQLFYMLKVNSAPIAKQKLLRLIRRNESMFIVQYISRVLGAITELGLESKFSDQSVPTIDDVNYSTYVNLAKTLITI